MTETSAKDALTLIEKLLVQEGGRKPPPYPSVFIKGSHSIADCYEDITIPEIVVSHDGQLDYEGEMCIVIGKTGKDIPKDKVLEHVSGYATGNDVSSRRWQKDPAYAGGVPQWNFAKGFDKWCPVGPQLVSPKVCNLPVPNILTNPAVSL